MNNSTNNSTCLTGGAGVVITDVAGCADGFYCPNNTGMNFAEYCPPTTDCQMLRFFGGKCDAQGAREPVVCPPGFYCPQGGKKKNICPEGSFCPEGSWKPWPCEVGTVCGEGAVKRFDVAGLTIVILIDIALIIATAGVSLWKKRRKASASTATARASAISASSEKTFGTDDCTSFFGNTLEQGALVSDSQATTPEIPPDEFDPGHDLQALVHSYEKMIDGKHLGLGFDFQDLSLKLNNGRELLSGVSGTIERGSMWGVMGPSGAATFMNVLMGKVSGTSGTLSVNGVKKHMKSYKRIIGYVPQDDIVFAELTVRENILHSARCRLPATWAEAEIQLHTDRVISCLSLIHVQHSLVGDAVRPVLSGGQRKRVNIGIELAAAPMCLFCDEPTSGLDATSALSVVKLLQAISRLGVTVVSVIHQPRTEIYECLDNVLLIAKGRPLWSGPKIKMTEHLKGEGYKFKRHLNPADVIMDIISGDGFRHRSLPRANEVDYLIDKWSTDTRNGATLSGPDPPQEMLALLIMVKLRGAYWYKQAYFCFLRSLVQQKRQISSLSLELFVGALAGLLMGLASSQAEGHLFQGLYKGEYALLSSAINYDLVPEIGLIAGLAIGLAGSPSGVKVFGDEKMIYWREAASGHSRSAYYVGKVISTFFRITLAALHFTVFFYLLATPIINFGETYLLIVLDFYCIYGLASCVSMVTRKENGALLSVVTGLIVSIFCGYGPSLKQAKEWHMEWFWRMCPGTYFAEGLFTKCVSPFAGLYQIDQAADATGYTLGQFEVDVMALIIIGTVYRAVAYGGLTLVHRSRQR